MLPSRKNTRVDWPHCCDGGAPGWPQPNTLGIVIDGPARVGWYFSPGCTAPRRELSRDASGPVFLPARAHRTFNIDYDPYANNGAGRVTVSLDGE